MEGNKNRQQHQALIKKEPLRVRSYASLRQHEQQQVAASVRGPRGPGLLNQQRQLLLRPEAQGICDPKQPAVRPSAVFPSVLGSSSTAGGKSVVKFMPNVSVKPETAEATKAGSPATALSSALGVDALLLRSLHNRQPAQQPHGPFGRPKLRAGPIRQPCDPVPAQQRQSASVGLQQGNSSESGTRRGPRSLRLSDLAHDDSQGHLFLPITIPFKRHTRHEHQGQVDQGMAEVKTPLRILEKQRHRQDDVFEIDTAASTPNHLGNGTSAKLQQRAGQEAPHQSASTTDSNDIPAASLLRDQFVASNSEHFLDEDGRPEFVQLCFPELLPPLDIPAMQALPSERKPHPQAKKEQHTKAASSSNSANNPTPLQALPSGRIGQLFIRRSGRVHLRLLTEACGRAETNTNATPTRDFADEQQSSRGAAATLQSGDICYDVLVGTEGSFAQEVGCMLSETNEFIFLGRCTRKLIITADIRRAIAPLSQRNC